MDIKDLAVHYKTKDTALKSFVDQSRGKINELIANANKPVELKYMPWVDVRNFGAKGDGVADDTAAILAGLAAQPAIYLSEGTYKISAGIAVGVGKKLYGPSRGTAIIKPTASVDVAITLNSGKLKNISLDGANTDGKIGLLCGSVLSAGLEASDLNIYNFIGAGAVGLKLRQAIESSFPRIHSFLNTKNLYISAEAGDGTPTTAWFRDSLFREAVEEGVLQVGGKHINFFQSVFESNHKEGLKIMPGAGDVAIHGILHSCWFENNWVGDGARPTKYSLVVDGTGAGSYAGLYLDNVFFAGSALTEKAIDFNKVMWTSLSKVTVPPAVAGAIRIQNALSEVTFIDDAGRTALLQTINPDGAPWVFYPVEGILNSAGVMTPYLLLPVYANNAAALAGGLIVGQSYRTNADPDQVCVVH